MNGLKINYKSYFGTDFIALCFFDKVKDGVKLTACLCTEKEEAPALSYSVNNATYNAEFYYSQAKSVEGRVVYFNYFVIEMSLEKMRKEQKITFGNSLPIATFSQFPIDSRSLSYHLFDGLVMYINENALCVSPAERSVVSVVKKRRAIAMRRCFKNDRNNVIKATIMRIFHRIFSPFFKKDIWLVADRKGAGGDNGEVFFEYLMANKPKNASVLFVINKDSPDTPRIKKMGKVIYPRTFKYKLYYTFATRLIASQLEYDIVNPIAARDYLKDILYKCKIVFLQHGIIKDDLSPTYNRYERTMDAFITSTVDEYNSIAKSHAYGYGEKIVKLTGLARFDKLTNHQEKIVFICPSWRKYCLKDTEKQLPIDNIEDTEAYKLYKEILSNNELIATAKRLGYKL